MTGTKPVLIIVAMIIAVAVVVILFDPDIQAWRKFVLFHFHGLEPCGPGRTLIYPTLSMLTVTP